MLKEVAQRIKQFISTPESKRNLNQQVDQRVEFYNRVFNRNVVPVPPWNICKENGYAKKNTHNRTQLTEIILIIRHYIKKKGEKQD